MYLHPLKFLSSQNRRLYRKRITQNERYKKLLPFIQRYNFISHRAEQSTRKENDDFDENSSQELQVHHVFILFLLYG
jgi:hypothetical protein